MRHTLPLSLRFALRELRGGLKGFGVFLACIILGVAAIATVGAVREAISNGISENGQLLLGGDIELRLTNMPMADEAEARLADDYTMSRSVHLRSMAAGAAGRATIELKAVDGLYPLYGAVDLDPAIGMDDALAFKDGRWGVVADPVVLRKTGVGVGETLRIGNVDYQVRAAVIKEPDQAADGFTLGSRAMVALGSLNESGLIQPGSLVRYKYRLAVPEGTDIDAITTGLLNQYPDAGWRIRDRDNGADGLRQFLLRLTVFLSLAGLTALVVGGVGVANATTGYLVTKRESIATLKSLGADGGLIFRTYLTQVLLLALAGIAIGLLLGALIPFAALAALQDMLPVPAEPTLAAGPLILAAGYGLFTVLAFAVWPLGRARDIPAAGLFRQIVSHSSGLPRWHYTVLAGAATAMLAGLALTFSDAPQFTAWFMVGALACFGVLYAAGWGLTRLAARLPKPKNTVWRMALANLHRPGAATPTVVLSLGLGLTLLVTVAQIWSNLNDQIKDRLPDNAPAFFFVDVQPGQVEAFEALVRDHPGVEQMTRAPMLRAAITRVNGVRPEDANVAPDAQWALRGDRGLTYATDKPQGNIITAGTWWDAGYSGPPLISFDADLAEGMGLGLGDTLTFNIMGRAIEATIGNLRRIDWSSMSMNFSVIFAPGTLERAPHTHMVVVQLDAAHEDTLDAAVAREFPAVTAINVRETLQSINGVLRQINQAITWTSVVALLAGVLVLAGAMAAGYHERVREAVILKVLGATRGHVARTYLVEYALMGLVTALIAMALGTAAAWLVMTVVMQANWIWQPEILIGTAVIAMILTVFFGFLGTWRALGEKAAPVLRTE